MTALGGTSKVQISAEDLDIGAEIQAIRREQEMQRWLIIGLALLILLKK